MIKITSILSMLLLTATCVRADVNETNTMTAISSITASAFFGDGSHLTGVALAGSANTFTSTLTATGLSQFSSIGISTSIQAGGGGAWVWAKSIDGTQSPTLSSGCAVALQPSDNTPSAFLQFSSTSTPDASYVWGILLDPGCAPGSVCRVGIHGFFYAQCVSGMVVGTYNVLAGSRCKVTDSSVVHTQGITASTNSVVGNNCWVFQK